MIILASKSPRRQQLLHDAGFEFKVETFDVDESYPEGLVKGEISIFLAEKKAKAYPHPLNDNILICADTIVCLDEHVLNKPVDAADAIKMLKQLSGRMHEVYTGVCIRKGEIIHSFAERTEVYFKPLTDEEINAYVEKFKPFDKAGAYGIQEYIGYIGVEKIVGCYYNVMGLPVSRLYREMKISGQ